MLNSRGGINVALISLWTRGTFFFLKKKIKIIENKSRDTTYVGRVLTTAPGCGYNRFPYANGVSSIQVVVVVAYPLHGWGPFMTGSIWRHFFLSFSTSFNSMWNDYRKFQLWKHYQQVLYSNMYYCICANRYT